MISRTHIVVQKPRERQLNAKVCGSKCAIFRTLSFFLRYEFCSNNDNDSRTHLDFSTKRMRITARSFPATQHLHILKFTLFDESHLTLWSCCPLQSIIFLFRRPLCSTMIYRERFKYFVILARDWCLSQRGTLQLLSVLIYSDQLINKSHSQHCSSLCRTPFSNFVRMHTRSLVIWKC